MADKLDHLIPLLIGVTKKEFRERFKRPERDSNTNLYVDTIFGGSKDQTIFLAKT